MPEAIMTEQTENPFSDAVNFQALELKYEDFRRISDMVGAITGMNLHDGKEDLVKTRLLKRIRLLSLKSFKAYLQYVEDDKTGLELKHMVDVLTTNKTSFFREPEHFDFMRDSVIPKFKNRTLRIWSAGCSSGEEPYTIAMCLRAHIPDLAFWDAKILATDISSRMLLKAQSGIYTLENLAGLTPNQISAHFRPVDRHKGHDYKVVPEVADLVSFARLNLMEDWPMQGPFDAIFCRNVMIYFNKETQERLVNRFWQLIKPGGHLLVGHSESLSALKHPYKYLAPATYLKH